MSALIGTYSKFFYGYVIDTDNYYLNFKEGAGPELTATLNAGEYTLDDFLTEIKIALENAGALIYTVVADRSLRIITISTPSTFSLLVSTGTNAGTSAFTLIGFTGADRTGASTYTANNPAGSEYNPQFKLQSYISSDNWQASSESSINKTASGIVEIINFGIEKFYQFNIQFTTDIPQPCNSPILNNPTGLLDLQLFLQYCVTRAPLEFMPDKNLPNIFYKIILESTTDSQTGTGYKIKELYDKNLPGYYDTGIIKWRLIES